MKRRILKTIKFLIFIALVIVIPYHLGLWVGYNLLHLERMPADVAGIIWVFGMQAIGITFAVGYGFWIFFRWIVTGKTYRPRHR